MIAHTGENWKSKRESVFFILIVLIIYISSLPSVRFERVCGHLAQRVQSAFRPLLLK